MKTLAADQLINGSPNGELLLLPPGFSGVLCN
jgi:hypothetical protein